MNLGLDISTSAIGFCVLDSDKVIDIFATSLDKKFSIFQKARFFKEELLRIKKDFNIKNIYVEENLQAFRPGLSSAKTIVTLARFNGMCSLIVSDVFEKDPEFVNVNSARKLVGFKKIKSEISTKDQVFNFVRENESNISWPTKVLKNGPRRGTEVFENFCYDMADAYVIVKSQSL